MSVRIYPTDSGITGQVIKDGNFYLSGGPEILKIRIKEQIKKVFDNYKDLPERDALRLAIDDYHAAHAVSKFIGDDLHEAIRDSIYDYFNTIV